MLYAVLVVTHLGEAQPGGGEGACHGKKPKARQGAEFRTRTVWVVTLVVRLPRPAVVRRSSV